MTVHRNNFSRNANLYAKVSMTYFKRSIVYERLQQMWYARRQIKFKIVFGMFEFEN